ncbi:disease resistance protein SUMM2-like [Vicia villosa]|uniref:disease resistance protein SUMM2-like n=1 Tax=Vicia villosa TaxID=3911 RepID=UPI00273B3E9D|nr:disease resistance protein SUMM2-like [Vicia villosa]
MTSFLIDYAKKNVEKSLDGVLKELRYICCFTCIAKEFEEEKTWLEAERTTVGQRVKVAKRRGDDVQDNVIFWEEEADKIIQEDTKTNKKCFFGLCPDCIWRYRRGKELANKKDQIKKLMKTGKELGIGLPAPLPDVDRYSSRHYISFKSRESKCKELLDALKDDNNYIVGLQGIGGTGKTTLAKEVGKKLKQSKQFTYIIDTTVSFSPNIKKIQDDIAGPLGLTFDGCSESDRSKKLWKGLTSGEKILLILDDVWGDIDFEEIGIPYSDNHNGCRILVTTRNVLVCNKLECSKTIRLEFLSQDDAWEMFKRHASLTEISSKSLLDKGFKIANECQGLPIAIAVIASSLKGKHQVEWDVALKSLKKHAPIHEIDDDLVKIYECLKFSYDNMNDGKSKRLFLLCSVFPEDEEIPTERLMRHGIGAGLFGENYGNYDDARSQVVISKKKLLDSCLLLEVDQDRVKMHDLVRDAAQWIAKKEIQTIKLYDKKQKAMVEREKNIKYLFCEGKLKDVLSCKLDSSKLQILIVRMQMDGGFHDEKHEVPNSFFENISGLRVFHLISDFYPPTVSLPKSIQSLKNIRALLVNGVDLGDISILGNLQSLETLDLDWCKINELPEGLAKLQKLILLKLINCEIIRNNPFKVIEGCSSLEELYFVGSFNDYCREISLPMLQRFILDDRKRYDEIGSLSKSVSLEYPEDEHLLSEKLLKDCIQVVEVLRLKKIWWEWVNIIPEIVPMDHGMNDLVRLKLSCISQLKCLIDTKHNNSQVTTVFSKLVVLKLEEMESLRELCNGPISFDSLKSLEKLTIEGCNQLQSLFACNLNLFNLKSLSLIRCPMLIFSLFELTTSRSLVSLEELVIIDCRQLEYIIIDERKVKESRRKTVLDDDDNNDRKRSQDSIFPKLKDLHIYECPGLKYIFPFLSVQDLPSLETIIIYDCEKLQHIFGHNLINNYLKCDDVITSSPISRNASKPKQQSDPMKCSPFSWTNICCFGKKSMTTAKTEIPLVSEDQHQHIVIDKGDHQSEFHLQLPAMKCLHLRNLPCLVATCPKLYRTTFPHLEELDVHNCLQFAIKSIGDLTIHSASQSLDSTIKKDLTKETTSFLVGPKNSFSLSQLSQIKIFRCEKLEIMFSTSILRCLPELFFLRIEECKELKHIIEDDLENEKSINFQSTNTYFPKLEILVVVNCNKLKCVFQSSVCKELPKLKVLIIKEAYELQEIFKTEGDEQKLGIPNLEMVAFINLPNLCHAQGMHFQAVETRLVHNCHKLSLASASKLDYISEIIDYLYNIDASIYWELHTLLQQLVNVCDSHDTCNGKPSSENTQEFAIGVQAEASSESGSRLTSSQPQVLMNEHSMDQQHSLGETDTTIKPQEDGDFQIAATSLFSPTTETNDEVCLNGDAFKKVSSNIEEQFTNDDKIIFSKSKPSPSISSPFASQFPSISSKGDPSQKVEELSSFLPITKELEQLVLKKHLDYENSFLLTDFLYKHPSVLLKDNSLSNRYKGYAYNCLAELLKFLQTHSVLDVLGSNHYEFVELLQDVRKCGFDKDWLDGIERRILFPNLKHQLTSSEAVLESIIQQKRVLSAPIGY